MSDTPRTRAATFEVLSTLQPGVVKVVTAEFADRLENEIASLKRGEFICVKCGIMEHAGKDGISPELRTW